MVWGVGAFQLSAGMPPLNPSRERICQYYAHAGDSPVLAAPLPAEIGPIAQYGRPYWATWMPPFTPREPAAADPYPACMQKAQALATAQLRFEDEWAAWRAARSPMVGIWAMAPLCGLPALALAIGFVSRLPQRQRAPGPSPAVPSRAPTKPLAPSRSGAALPRSAALLRPRQPND